jgi:hypothetical protein
VDGGLEGDVIGADYDFVAVVILDEREKFLEEGGGLVGSFVHFPVGG